MKAMTEAVSCIRHSCAWKLKGSPCRRGRGLVLYADQPPKSRLTLSFTVGTRNVRDDAPFWFHRFIPRPYFLLSLAYDCVIRA
jgi:hypothetical protein